MDADLRRRVMQGNVHTDDPLREITRKERRALLGVSTASILIAKTGLVPSEIQNLGIKFTSAEQSTLLLGLAVVVTYFLIVFIVYAMTDWLGVMWGLHVDTLELQHQARLSEIKLQHQARLREIEGDVGSAEVESDAGSSEVESPEGGRGHVPAAAARQEQAPFKFRRLTVVMSWGTLADFWISHCQLLWQRLL